MENTKWYQRGLDMGSKTGIYIRFFLRVVILFRPISDRIQNTGYNKQSKKHLNLIFPTCMLHIPSHLPRQKGHYR